MDYYVLIIFVLTAMLIPSIVLNFILIRRVEFLQDADIIDDITPNEEFYELSKEQRSKIIYF